MLKNPTPREVAFNASLFIVLLYFVFAHLLDWLALPINPIFSTFFKGLVLFGINFIIIMYFLRRFIYRRIKVIYKNIHKYKRAKSDKLTLADIGDTIVDEVEKEVDEWVENQAREIQHLKSLEEYRRIYLGNVAHELKTPIFSIQGYIHTLLDGGLYDDKINVNYLNRAAKNTERLQTIIEDLDKITKLESGKLTLEMGVFDIKVLALSVVDELEIMAKEKNMALILKDGANHNFQVRADKAAIRQVFSNLISNSIKYGKESGTTKLSFYDMDKYILVEVSDNGRGIAADHLPYVFDRFYRADKSRSRAIGGSGLGLSIVKHIIEAHEQTINVRSALDLGATFGFTLEKVG